MKAMVLDAPGRPLVERRRRRRKLRAGEVRVRVSACGVCRTDLHLVDGELPDPSCPVVPGHEIVGTVIDSAPDVALEPGLRVGIPWLGWSCGACDYCRAGQENLCPEARFTGYQIDGGYAEEAIADARFVFPLPRGYDDLHAAPLLCAGLIGYRTLSKAGDARRLGIYGFGAAAHIVAQVARWQGREVYAFARPGDTAAMDFAREQGACWAGGSDELAPEPLDAALLFAPVGALVPAALAAVRPGGTVVCGGIYMSDIPSFPYALLWGERVLCSVANLTRRDAEEFLALADTLPIHTEVVPYPLARANEALDDLRAGRLQGAAVLVPDR
ncbi:MAG: zinc-dependent alcohol dehydrogenase family protein [Gammaproteobacteria bacterium]|jgi:propanol-preferring alcohol dehydrogenase